MIGKPDALRGTPGEPPAAEGTLVGGPADLPRIAGVVPSGASRTWHAGSYEGRGERRGIFVLWAAPPGGVAPPTGED
jgi:hypothetical protein